MAIELKLNTNIFQAVDSILAGEVNPIIDFDNIRYSIDVSAKDNGMIRWTPYNITTQEIIGTVTYVYPYAAHNIMLDAIFGASSKTYSETTREPSFPNFPVPVENGFVTP